jgi:hypothetical protein
MRSADRLSGYRVPRPRTAITAGGAFSRARWRFVRGHPARTLRLVVAAALLTVLGSSVATAANSTSPPVSTANWQHVMRQLRVPGKGCFAASYPILRWRRTECGTAPHRPYAPQLPAVPAPRPQTVGDGSDYLAGVTGSPLASVTGSFDGISPGTTETQQVSGKAVPNTFSLQLNTQTFQTPACSASPQGSGCQGWEQFIYSTSYNGIAIQYWLLNYDTTCPSGWATYHSTDCWTNSSGSRLSGSALTVQDLPDVTLTGNATGSGDSVILTTASQAIRVNTGSSVLDLAPNWTGAEWTIVGDCCLNDAIFSPGTTLILRTTVNDGGTNAIPTCKLQGFTGETNNLNLPAGPGLGEQTLQSGETSSPPASPPTCADAYLIGADPGGGLSVRAGNPVGEADLVTEGADHTLQYYWATPGGQWHHAQLAGDNSTYSAPSAFVRPVDPEGEADITAEGPDHTLQYYWATPGGQWHHTQIAGDNSTYSAPSIFVRSVGPEGEADVTAEGPDHTLQYFWATPGGQWHHIELAADNSTYSAPSIFVRSADPEGEADITAEGANHTLQYYWATPSSIWRHAQVAGKNSTYSAPSVFVRSADPEGEVDIVFAGASNTLQYYWATPGSQWRHTQVAGNGTTHSTPSIFVRPVDPAGEADIATQGASNTLLYYWATPGSPWLHVQVAGNGTTYSG